MSMERRQIVKMWQQGNAGVLVTLVRVEGSSYRRPGARLLTAAGEERAPAYAGTISGGCLEAEVVRKAAWMARAGAHVERYSMLFDDTAEIPFGLGCGGVVDLLFEPVDAPEAQALLAAMERSLMGSPSRVVSFLPGAADGSSNPARALRRLILDGRGEVVFQSPGLSPEKLACGTRLLPGGDYEGRFVEQLDPPQRLVVLGAGDDARALVRMAALLGWTVLVADGRAQLARAERFPEAEHVIALPASAEAGRWLHLSEDDAVIVMTHSYEQDRDLLAAVLPVAPRYLGLLGSRHRSSLLVAEVAERLARPIEACCEALYAPVGLDLGGDGPEAIALAIVSEAQAVCQGRRGVRDHLTEAEIVRQLARGGVSRYMQIHCALDEVS